jgi:hypothetical protein
MNQAAKLPRVDQRLHDADSHAHRHADDRCPNPSRDQDFWLRPRRDRARRTGYRGQAQPSQRDAERALRALSRGRVPRRGPRPSGPPALRAPSRRPSDRHRERHRRGADYHDGRGPCEVPGQHPLQGGLPVDGPVDPERPRSVGDWSPGPRQRNGDGRRAGTDSPAHSQRAPSFRSRNSRKSRSWRARR